MSLLGPAAALASSFTWAIGSSTYSRITRSEPPMIVNFTRTALSLPFFFVIVFFRSGANPVAMAHAMADVPTPNVLWFLVSVVASYGLGDIFFLLSSRYVGITAALAIASAYPLVTVAYELTQGRMLLASQTFGLVLTLASVIWVIVQTGEPVDSNELRPRRPVLGIALAFVTCVFWAMNVLSVSKGGDGIEPWAGNLIRMTMAFLFIAVAYGLTERKFPRLIARADLRRSAWAFIVESVAGSFLYVYGMSHSPLVLASTLSSLAPVIVVPVAVMMGIERFSLKKTIAVVGVVVGVYFLTG